jgi:hypothetical protein
MDARCHWGFEDPAKAQGSEDEVLEVFRKVRDEILRVFETYAASNNNKELPVTRSITHHVLAVLTVSTSYQKLHPSSSVCATQCAGVFWFPVPSEDY